MNPSGGVRERHSDPFDDLTRVAAADLPRDRQDAPPRCDEFGETRTVFSPSHARPPWCDHPSHSSATLSPGQASRGDSGRVRGDPVLSCREWDTASSNDRPRERLERRLQGSTVASLVEQLLEASATGSARRAQGTEAARATGRGHKITADQVFGDREKPVILEAARHVDQRAGDGRDRYPFQLGAIGAVQSGAAVHRHERRSGISTVRDPDLGLRRPNAVEFPQRGGRTVRHERVRRRPRVWPRARSDTTKSARR